MQDNMEIRHSESFYSYLVMNKDRYPLRPEFRIDPSEVAFTKPNLLRYQTATNLILEIRETFVYRHLSAADALKVGSDNPGCLFRFIDDPESATLHSSEDFCETVKWSYSHPRQRKGDGTYSFFMDRILSPEEQKAYIKSLRL